MIQDSNEMKNTITNNNLYSNIDINNENERLLYNIK